MGLIQNWLRKRNERKEEQGSYERGIHIRRNVDAKQLSSNERELMTWEEQERQKRIKATLEKFRKIENDEVWSGRKTNPLYAPNIIKDHKQLFTGGNMFANQESIMKTKNLFFNKKW